MRIHEECAFRGVDGQKTSRIEVKVRGRWAGRKGIRDARGTERIGEVGRGAILTERGKGQAGTGEEWRLPVELQIIFTLQDVVEHPESATNAGFTIPARIPGEADARRPIGSIGKIHTPGRARISGEHHSRRSSGKTGGLQAGNDRE